MKGAVYEGIRAQDASFGDGCVVLRYQCFIMAYALPDGVDDHIKDTLDILALEDEQLVLFLQFEFEVAGVHLESIAIYEVDGLVQVVQYAL